MSGQDVLCCACPSINDICIMPGKFLRSILIGLIVGGLLLAVMPSLRQWQLSPTTQYDSADESPPAIIPPFAAPPCGGERL
jgi:serine protease DegS